MSLSTCTCVGVVRDATNPAGQTVSLGDKEVTWGKALVAVIPTEVLTAYTAGLTLATPADPGAYLPFRFAWYWAWLVATPVMAWLLLRRKATASPIVAEREVAGWNALRRPEIVAPTIAAAAWFTAMPGSPWQVHASAGGFQITALIALSVGSLLVGLIAPALTRPTDYTPVAEPAAAQSRTRS